MTQTPIIGICPRCAALFSDCTCPEAAKRKAKVFVALREHRQKQKAIKAKKGSRRQWRESTRRYYKTKP